MISRISLKILRKQSGTMCGDELVQLEGEQMKIAQQNVENY